MSEPYEEVDVVDETDVVIDRATRQEAHARGLLHRAVHVLAVDGKGHLILQKRAANRPFNPGRWTSTTSGHVAAARGYDETARREIMEELGLPRAPKMRRIGKVLVEARGEKEGHVCRAWSVVYEASLGQVPDELNPQIAELSAVESFAVDDVASAVRGERELADHAGQRVEFATKKRGRSTN